MFLHYTIILCSISFSAYILYSEDKEGLVKYAINTTDYCSVIDRVYCIRQKKQPSKLRFAMSE
jgi:hypothetical protein